MRAIVLAVRTTGAGVRLDTHGNQPHGEHGSLVLLAGGAQRGGRLVVRDVTRPGGAHGFMQPVII